MFDNAVTYVHMLLRTHVEHGDVVLDATAGNGWDAAVLAEGIGAAGRLYCFDVQQVALDVTSARLRGADADVRMVKAGHEGMIDHIDTADMGRVRAITFNLGYLPGGDKAITTHVETTRRALDAAVNVMAPDGLMTIVCYRHAEGEREREAVASFLAGLDQDRWTATELQFVNQRGTPPVVFTVVGRRQEPEPLPER